MNYWKCVVKGATEYDEDTGEVMMICERCPYIESCQIDTEKVGKNDIVCKKKSDG